MYTALLLLALAPSADPISEARVRAALALSQSTDVSCGCKAKDCECILDIGGRTVGKCLCPGLKFEDRCKQDCNCTVVAKSPEPVRVMPKPVQDTTGYHWMTTADGTQAGLFDAKMRQIGAYRFADSLYRPLDGETWGKVGKAPIVPPMSPPQAQPYHAEPMTYAPTPFAAQDCGPAG